MNHKTTLKAILLSIFLVSTNTIFSETIKVDEAKKNNNNKYAFLLKQLTANKEKFQPSQSFIFKTIPRETICILPSLIIPALVIFLNFGRLMSRSGFFCCDPRPFLLGFEIKYGIPSSILSYICLKIIFYIVSNKLLKENITNLNALTEFVKNWKSYKLVTPSEFHSKFEELYKEYSENNKLKLTEDKAKEIINSIITKPIGDIQSPASVN